MLLRLLLLMGLLGAVSLAQADFIVGSWVQDSQEVTWTFRNDGSGFMERGNPRTTARFSWTLEGNILKLSTSVGTPIVYQITSHTPTQMVIVNRRLAMEYTLRRQ